MGLREEYLEEITSQEGIREGFASGEGIKSGREKAEGISFWRELDFGSGKCRRELALIPSLRGGGINYNSSVLTLRFTVN